MLYIKMLKKLWRSSFYYTITGFTIQEINKCYLNIRIIEYYKYQKRCSNVKYEGLVKKISPGNTAGTPFLMATPRLPGYMLQGSECMVYHNFPGAIGLLFHYFNAFGADLYFLAIGYIPF
jgi:hypothetical protein